MYWFFYKDREERNVRTCLVGQSGYSAVKSVGDKKVVSNISLGHDNLSFGKLSPSQTDVYVCLKRAKKLCSTKGKRQVKKPFTLEREMARM